MAKERIRQKAADNFYYHKDFHIALNYVVDYLYRRFGANAVREYLQQFTEAYYIPLKETLKEKGLTALKQRYEDIYKIEGAEFNMQLGKNDLLMRLESSPAYKHIQLQGHIVSPMFSETVKTVMKSLCCDTPYDVEIMEYNDENSAYTVRFYRRIN